MDDVIDGLLRIKTIREESREAELRRARAALELAAEQLRRANEERQRRDRERAERESRLYADVCSRVVLVRDLNDLKDEVAVMKEAALADGKAVSDAQETRQKRRGAFDEAMGAWHAAAQARQKFETLSEESRVERERLAEWQAELELEEFSARPLAAQAFADEAEEA